ncbi:MAG: TrkA family potassium uptake protein [Frankiales bacterium]|nr:TrkA family potassium uptake protein [Frankiales bacterium]
MHVVIMGCGRVGSALAKSLELLNHDVAVIDRDASAFRRLPESFQGRRVSGVGFDRDTLVEAGIEGAHAFAAVSNGDNSNIIAARVARETFGVENVVARIYDARRAEVYEKLGIPTVATVRWTADQVLRRLLPQGLLSQYRDPSGRVALAEVAVAPEWIGSRLSSLEAAAGVRCVFITRLGVAQLPKDGTVVQEGDLVHVALEIEDRERVVDAFAAGPKEDD